MKAWHWTNGNTLLDGLTIPVGEWLIHEGPVVMCRSGYHASKRVLDALCYAPGHTVWRVECEDIAGRESDKFVCRRRKHLWCVEAEDLLRDFARRCALDVIHLWDAPDVVVRYLKTGDESIRADAWAAGAAAWDVEAAARAAAWAAAGDDQNRRLTQMIVAAHKKEVAA